MPPLHFAGHDFQVAGGRALFWPARAALIVADLHLEKASWFAARGQMLPPHDSLATLSAVAALVEATGAREVWCLGDNFHDSDGATRLLGDARATLARLTDMLDWVWITGNHDPAPPQDVGGIIVCDFIDMETQGNRDKVIHELLTHLGRDRARTKAHAVSDLGLVEMTRQRVRQSHWQSMTESCPTCSGTGRVFTPETIVRRTERAVRRMSAEGRREPVILRLHPEVALHVLEQEHDFVKRLEKLAGFPLELRDDPLLRPDEIKLVMRGAQRDVTQQYALA